MYTLIRVHIHDNNNINNNFNNNDSSARKRSQNLSHFYVRVSTLNAK